MARLEASVVGKNIFTYVPKGNKSYTHKDISQYLKKFKLCDALRLIGEFSFNVFKHTEGTFVYKDIPITLGILAYLSMRLVENSNDYRSSDMSKDDLLVAIDMYFGLADPFMENNENPLGCLLRAGASQFDYDRELRHTIPRTLVLYQRVWNQLEECASLNISEALQNMIGLSLNELLGLSFTFFSTASRGYLQTIENLEQFPEPLQKILAPEKQQAFLDWISCSYQEFRVLSRAKAPPSEKYEHFRFNPLYVKPAITPDRSPKQGMGQVYITPVPTLINYRVTNGLYFALSDYFSELTGTRAFRDSFGYAFQTYAGILLRQAFGKENVIPEWEYVHKKNRKNTPDWIVICNGRAVVLEIKQSGLFLPAKLWANEEDIRKNLKDNVGKGALQMWKFQNDLDKGICEVPEALKGIEIVEKMVVTFDRSYFLNSIMRDEIRQIYPELPSSYHWHTIAVEELEYLLGSTGPTFIDFLEAKRSDSEHDKMDFKDYQSYVRARSGNTGNLKNTYLDNVFEDFFSDLGLEQLADKIPNL
jgi:hypothetical protein